MAVQGGVKLVAWKVYNCDWPTQGSAALGTPIAIPVAGSVGLDLQIEASTGELEFVQAMFVDNSLNSVAVSITNTISNAKMIVPPFSQAFLNMLAPPQSKWTFAASAPITVPIQALNFPVSTAVWSVNAPAGTPGGVAGPVFPYGTNQTPLAGSATGAASAATVTFAGVAGKTNYITGIQITGAGATAASVVVGQITGVIGGPLNFDIAVPAGAAIGIQPIVANFAPPLAATGVNVTVTATIPSFGAGNTNSAINMTGYQQ